MSGFYYYLTGEKKKPIRSKKQIEEQNGQDSESRYLESEERAAKNYWDSVIAW